MKDAEELMEEMETEFCDFLDELSKILTHDDYEYMLAKFRGILERRGGKHDLEVESMTWQEFKRKVATEELFATIVPTNITCPECGKYIWKRTDVVLTTYPPQYRYECYNCGWFGIQ